MNKATFILLLAVTSNGAINYGDQRLGRRVKRLIFGFKAGGDVGGKAGVGLNTKEGLHGGIRGDVAGEVGGHAEGPFGGGIRGHAKGAAGGAWTANGHPLFGGRTNKRLFAQGEIGGEIVAPFKLGSIGATMGFSTEFIHECIVELRIAADLSVDARMELRTLGRFFGRLARRADNMGIDGTACGEMSAAARGGMRVMGRIIAVAEFVERVQVKVAGFLQAHATAGEAYAKLNAAGSAQAGIALRFKAQIGATARLGFKFEGLAQAAVRNAGEIRGRRAMIRAEKKVASVLQLIGDIGVRLEAGAGAALETEGDIKGGIEAVAYIPTR